jgi:hypothetical protein
MLSRKEFSSSVMTGVYIGLSVAVGFVVLLGLLSFTSWLPTHKARLVDRYGVVSIETTRTQILPATAITVEPVASVAGPMCPHGTSHSPTAIEFMRETKRLLWMEIVRQETKIVDLVCVKQL